MSDLCSCVRCVEARIAAMPPTGNPMDRWPGPLIPGWRYNCELCGNKRCPHHTDHRLACTRSNEPGQPGSDWT